MSVHLIDEVKSSCESVIDKMSEQLEKSIVPCDFPGDISISREELMVKIQGIILKLVKALAGRTQPHFVIEKVRSWTFCEVDQILRMNNIENKMFMRFSPQRIEEFAIHIYILSKVYRLLATNRTVTRREIYYENKTLLVRKRRVDSAVTYLSRYLEVPPWLLGVLTTSKGLVAGPLRFRIGSTIVDCNTPTGIQIPIDVFKATEFETEAKFLLIVEKDAIFERLLDEEFIRHLGPCILITGKGVPDAMTRLLVRMVTSKMLMPSFALVDPNPYGIEIMLLYKFGSRELCHLSKWLAVPQLAWLGVFPSDIAALSLSTQSLSQNDSNLLRTMHLWPQVQTRPAILAEVKLLIESRTKAEIEDLVKFSPTYITNVYIPHKISNELFIV